MLTILRAIAQEQSPRREDIQAAVLEFNDGEWEVQSALLRLDYDALDRFDIPLGYRTRLQMAASGKASLRRDLQNTINTPDGRLPLTKDEALELVQRIEALNQAIESLDEMLRS